MPRTTAQLRLLAITVLALGTTACGTAAGTPSGSGAGSPPAGATTPAGSARPARTPAPTDPPLVPLTSTIDGIKAMTLRLGDDELPLDVAVAFGSVWVASHHGNTVVRLDPETMAVQARVPAGSGPGWFAVTDDAVWVSVQMGRGMSRIDPATNKAERQVAGQWAPCGAPAVAMGSIWQPACDADKLMRIDPETREVTDFSWGRRLGVVAGGDALYGSGPLGIARFDPAASTFEELGGPTNTFILEYDGTTIWALTETETKRLRLSDKSVVTLPTPGIEVAFRGDHAWMTAPGKLLEIDLATNNVLRTIQLPGSPLAIADGGDALWITFPDGNSVLRLGV